jgi:hypothetical protein
MMLARRLVKVAVSAVILLGLLVASGDGDEKLPTRSGTLKDGFETPEPSWQREFTDTTVTLIAQERSPRAAREGRLSERFQFEAGPGSQFFVSYATPRIPVSDELSIGLAVRSNRAGAQIFARIVLPADIDPETRAPSYVLVAGTIFDQVDRWQRLELLHMIPAIERQARVLRVSTRRPVSLKGAYLERVVVNLLGGPGASEVFLDDLSIAPVPKDIAESRSNSETSQKSGGAPKRSGTDAAVRKLGLGTVRLERNLLEKKATDSIYRPWFPVAIDAPGANPVELRRGGFDVLFDRGKFDPARLAAAVEGGALLMVSLTGANASEGPQRLLEQMTAYPLRQAAVFWHVGEHLGRQREIPAREDEVAKVREGLAAIRGMDDEDSHLTIATVDGELPLFSRAPAGLDMIGIAPRMWSSAQEFSESYDFLNQRRLLTVRSNLGGLFWAWIPATTPPEVTRNIWGSDSPPSWGTPPVQPAQLRLMTYLALSAGYRGVGFLGDATLTRPTGAGRLLWIEMSLLNLEIDLCEQILAQNDSKIRDYGVYDPEAPFLPSNAIQLPQGRRPQAVKEPSPRPGMKAAAIPLQDRKGALLLVADYAGAAQYQPPQLAADEVTVTLALPEGAQAFEITPGGIRVLGRERVAVGTRITLKEFDTTSLVLCTSDLTMYERVRSQIESVRHKVVPLAIEQAEKMLVAVTETNGRLAADGHQFRSKVDIKLRRQAGIEGAPPDVPDLLAKSQESINNAREALERQDYEAAWADARRAMRPLRHVMFGHWGQAMDALSRAGYANFPKRTGIEEEPEDAIPRTKKKDDKPKIPRNPQLLINPVACPPGISFYSLPEHYIWVDWIKGRPGYRFGRNRVPSGDFDDAGAITGSGWVDVSYQLDGLVHKISSVHRDEPTAKSSGKETAKPDFLPPDEPSWNRAVKLEVKPERADELDTLVPQFLDFPVAAIRSPPIRVEANNLIMISVLVKRVWPSASGVGGVIVRDSIGGEQFQYRSSGAIPAYSRVLLFRKAPADGTFTVTLGLAGYGEVYFDDFRVQVIEQDSGGPPPEVITSAPRGRAGTSPGLPNPTLPGAASRPTNSRRQR